MATEIPTAYVEDVGQGALRVRGTRVSLDSVVYAYLQGQSPEGIHESFPALELEQIHGAIAFYLKHRPEVDAYLRQGEEKYQAELEAAEGERPEFWRRLDAWRDGRRSA